MTGSSTILVHPRDQTLGLLELNTWDGRELKVGGGREEGEEKDAGWEGIESEGLYVYD